MNSSSINEEIKGIVDSITYKNKDNGYTVIKLKFAKELLVPGSTKSAD